MERNRVGERGRAEPAVTTDAFWRFSLDVYRRGGVAGACIALQDEHGADVDVLLFVLWCAARGSVLDAAGLRAIDTAVAPWRSTVVQPLRQARRALKPPPPPPFDAAAATALRERLLAAEIEAERLQQFAMQAIAPPAGDAEPSDAARRNLSLYAEHAGVPPGAPQLAVLLRAVA